MPYIDVGNGVNIFVRDLGRGRPIMLLHGWPANHRIFEYHMMRLAERGYRVLAMDFRGFGLSDKPWEGNNYDAWAGDVGAVLQALDLRDVLLVGYSFGGAIAAHYLGTAQDPRVTKCALLAAAAPVAALTAPIKQIYDQLITGLQGDSVKPMQHYMSSMLVAGTLSAAMMAWLVEQASQTALWAAIRGLEELRDRDLSDDLRAMPLPVKILHGMLDATIPFPLAEEQKRLLPNATLIPIPNCDHAFIFEKKDQVVDELIDFAASPGTARAA